MDINNTNQPADIYFDNDTSVVSDFTESECDLTPVICDEMLTSLPLKLMPPRKAYRDDCVHHKMYTIQFNVIYFNCDFSKLIFQKEGSRT
jgi:hypothetical protein